MATVEESVVKLPQAISESSIDIAGHVIRCYQLDDGRRVFHADDVHAFFSVCGDDKELEHRLADIEKVN